MANSGSNTAIWEQIERSESFLICCMFEEAASLAFSVLKQICDNKSTEIIEASQMNDMMESAGMVLVQSWKELGRTSKLLEELTDLFGSVTQIPVLVILTSVCFQISEGALFGVREFLEMFLSKWRYCDGGYYVLASAELNRSYMESSDFVLNVGKYLEVVEVYAVVLLGRVLKDVDLAISWVEKAALPEEKRQQLLRRLPSLYPSEVSNLSQGHISPLLADECKSCSSLKEVNVSVGSPKVLEAQIATNGGNNMKHTLLKLSRRLEPYLWWFRSITLKFGSARLVMPNGNIVLGCLVFLIYFIFQKKRATLQRIAGRQAMSLKKAFVDLWQLAFSYQVNPLAAIQLQPQPLVTAGSR